VLIKIIINISTYKFSLTFKFSLYYYSISHVCSSEWIVFLIDRSLSLLLILMMLIALLRIILSMCLGRCFDQKWWRSWLLQVLGFECELVMLLQIISFRLWWKCNLVHVLIRSLNLALSPSSTVNIWLLLIFWTAYLNILDLRLFSTLPILI